MEDDELKDWEKWYDLMLYLEKDEDGHSKIPWKIIDGAPDWCEEVLEKWKEMKAQGFKVP